LINVKRFIFRLSALFLLCNETLEGPSMDITLARTFLEIVSSRSFAQAAEHLHVTQTAVSARVKTLEELLGRQLFVRNKAGASMTPAGEQFVRHAMTLVQVWERARQQMAVPPGRRALVSLGCEISLWHPLMLDWLLWMRQSAPDLALHTDVGVADDLLERVAHGTLDIVIAYAPRQRTGLRIELLIEEKLVLLSTSPNPELPQVADYVYVDWGSDFAAQHSLAFPALSSVGLSSSFGPLGLEYLLAVGGAGYFRQNVVQRHLQEGRLYRVPGAPEFLYPAYAVYAADADMAVLAPALAGLRQVAQVA
jgi:DNA-binding transcriptional LysR family regulator